MWVAGMARLCMCVSLCVSVWVRGSLGLPPQHRGWLRLWEEGEGCRDCDEHICPSVPDNCPAGRVQDSCGCCDQCANVEGQQCDPDGAQKFYGQCGEGLACRRKAPKKGRSADPEPTCVCQEKGPVCGSDGRTYTNVCQLREAASRAPRVLRSPKNLSNYTGNDIIFGCEVSAYPLPVLNWRKTGSDHYLPGDDPHISVQIDVIYEDFTSSQLRGGPQPYTVSTWLQIEGLLVSDTGVYSCISHNTLGKTSASAQLTVSRRGVKVTRGHLEEKEEHFDRLEEGSGDAQLASGDYLPFS